ncbi:MAG: tRNA nucleotidyltransferase/poly(A) polymerase [Parcubacteria group bacterium GW2011_GWA2_38_13]|nr:MAG: tRNA nucleotidyltransferase/poly(A) polymerase [Parcubacteria group bacterium GW2011_GWA2_38_13]
MPKKLDKNNAIAQFMLNVKKNPHLTFIKKIQKERKDAKIYLVGGMIRDLSLGKLSKDYDMVVAGILPKKLHDVLKKLGTVNLVGKTFGVFKLRPKLQATSYKLQADIDIALPRTEHSLGTGGYRDVEVQSDYRLPIEKDLERRDFTINAMALELELRIKNQELRITDPFKGIEDLKDKIIRCVGNPNERFAEDYSRMLRALRFCVQLGFTIEEKTWKSIVKNIKNINKKNVKCQKSSVKCNEYIVPREIIAKELFKMFAIDPVASLKILDESGMLELLMPEFIKMKKCSQPKQFHSEGDVWEHTMLALNFLNSKKFRREFPIPNSQPAHDLGKPYTMTKTDRIRFNEHDMVSSKLFTEISNRLKLSSAGLDTEKTKKIIEKHMILTHGNIENMKETTVEKYFFNDQFPGTELIMHSFCDVSATVPPSGKPDFTKYKLLKKRIASLKSKVKAKRDLPPDILDGNEIMKILKIPSGKIIGEIKEYLRELQLRGKITTKEEAKKKLIKQYK